MSEGAVPAAEGPSAGTLLREAREAAGLHTATLAATLKVALRKLEALEEDRYDLVGDAVFVRGLASSICRTLKIDPQPVLQRLPQTASPRLVAESEGINAPFRAPGDGPTPGLLHQVSRPVVITVAALLLGALVLVLLPMAQRDEPPAAPVARQPEPVMPPADTTVTAVPVPSTPEPAPAPVAPAPAAAVAASPANPMQPAAVPAAPVAATPAASAPNAAAIAQVPASGPIDARGVVAFRTRAQSWIQVTDAKGATVFQRLMGPGESAGATGALPLSVVIGSVEATEVQVRGKPYNLAPVSKDNVARFEVK